MRDSPAFLTCLTSCCRTCLLLTCLHRPSPGKLTSLLSLTTTSASASLVSVCSPGPDFSAWPRLPCCSSPVCSAASSACSSGSGFLASSTSFSVSPFLSLLPAVERNRTGPRVHVLPLSSVFRLSSTQSPSLKTRDFVWAPSLKNELFPVFPLLLEFLFCLCANKSHYQRSQISRVLLLGPNHTRHTGASLKSAPG